MTHHKEVKPDRFAFDLRFTVLMATLIYNYYTKYVNSISRVLYRAVYRVYHSCMASGITLREAARQLGTSTATVRRYIKAGKVNAWQTEGTYGPEYRVEIPPELLTGRPVPPEEMPSVGQLLQTVDRLNQEVGYWRGRTQAAEERLLLLDSPKAHWWLTLAYKLRARATKRPRQD